jgi:hypothetical protein
MVRNIYRLAAGVFTAFAVGMQYWFLISGNGGLALGSTIRFFSFFTILTNILAAIALLVPVLAPRSALGRFLDRPDVRTMITAYIIMVGTVYHLLLRGLSQREGWPLAFEEMLHYVTPPLFLIDWLLFVPKRDLNWRVGIAGLWFPIAYIVWTLVHGAVSGWYPYPFVDVGDLGYAQVAANIMGLVAIYLALAALLAFVGRSFAGARAEP